MALVIQRALIDHWTSLHTFVLIVLTEPELKRLDTYFSAVFRNRILAGHPIERLLLDQEYFQAISKVVPHLFHETQVALVSLTNYAEKW